MPTKLLWHANAPWAPTGYGTQTALFLPAFAERYQVAMSVNYGLEGSPLTWEGLPVLPGLGQDWGNSTIVPHAERFFGGDPRGGIVITLADVWPLEPSIMKKLNLACWCPVDHDPVPPKVAEFFRMSNAIPIAMSRFGQEQLKEFDPLYVPHAVDAMALSPMDKQEARNGAFPDDAWIVGIVGANKGHPSRKSFAQSLSAFAKFQQKHDNAYLYLHTALGPESHGGESIYALLSRLGVPTDRVRSADQYRLLFSPYTREEMRRLYASMDILLNPSFGEGFGIPIIEAQSCGTPVVVTDITAMPELCGGGWVVDHDPYWSALNSWQGVPKIDQIYDALEECYAMSDAARQKLSTACRAHALKYDAGRVLQQYWWPALREVEERFKKRGPVTIGKRKYSVAVVTPWHNHPEFAKDFYEAMDAAKPDELVVVDSGSDPPLENAAYRFEENVGQSAACNKGFDLARSEVVVFLNNDIRHVRKDWLDALLSPLEPGVLVGTWLRDGWHTEVDGENYPYLDGWCVAGFREDFEQLGLWDTTYEEPAYYGDNDLSLRAVACGMRLVEAQIGLEHLSNGTSGDDPEKRERIATRNHRLYEQRVRELQRLAA